MEYFGKANKASEEYKRNSAKEKIQLAIMSYQVNKEKTTLYDELRKIEGITYINPDNLEGPPYTVIVDGYKFEIKEDLELEYKDETSNQVKPKILEINYEKTQEVEELLIEIKAKIEDEAGLKQVILTYKTEQEGKTEYLDIAKEEVSGKESVSTFSVKFNGTYVIEVIGQNNQRVQEEIVISNIKEGGILAGITIGNLLEENQPTANLILTGKSEGNAIKAIELYINDNKVETYEYRNLEEQREEIYRIDTLGFYEAKKCYIKVIATNSEQISESKVVINDRIIKTTEDLKKLAVEVNENNNTFEGKTIELISDITTQANWTPIGYWESGDATIWRGKSFVGRFEGNNHSITITSLSKDETYQSSGLFGMGIGCNISNVTVNGRLDAQGITIGGIIGMIKNGNIHNCTNNSEIVDTKGDYHGGIIGRADNCQITNCTNTNTIYGNSEIGGIAGIAYASSSISNCNNSGLIKCYGIGEVKNGNATAQAGIVGGIIGKVNAATIKDCTNTGEITGNGITILPKGILAGGIAGQANEKANVITSKNKGNVHFDISSSSIKNSGVLGGVVGHLINATIDQCFNTATVSAKYNNNYRMNLIGGIVGYMNSSTVKNSYNKGEIYGDEKVGGVVGGCSVENGFTQNSYLYNNYNASLIVEGNNEVGNFSGVLESTTGAYNCALTETNANGNIDGNTCSFSSGGAYSLSQMKDRNSGTFLSMLRQGNGTVNGKPLWAQNSNINEGLPYLVNNS